MKSDDEIGQDLRLRTLIIHHRLAFSTDFPPFLPAAAAAVPEAGGGGLLFYKDKQDKEEDKDDKEITVDASSSSSCLIAVEETARDVKEEEGMKTPTDEADRIPLESECPGAPGRKEKNKRTESGVRRRRSCRRKLTFNEEILGGGGGGIKMKERRVLFFPR